jgi:hypothetical protein
VSYPVNHAAGGLLRDFLHAYLPPDAAERCRDVAHVHVTRVLPTFRPEVVSHFHDKDDLVQALITSAHIPYYANGKLVTEWRGRYDVGTHGLLGRLAGLNTNSRQLLSSRNSSKVEGSVCLSASTSTSSALQPAQRGCKCRTRISSPPAITHAAGTM